MPSPARELLSNTSNAPKPSPFFIGDSAPQIGLWVEHEWYISPCVEGRAMCNTHAIYKHHGMGQVGCSVCGTVVFGRRIEQAVLKFAVDEEPPWTENSVDLNDQQGKIAVFNLGRRM